MKKVIGLIVLAMMVVLPMSVKADIIFEESVKNPNKGLPGSKDGFYCDAIDKTTNTKTCYIVGRLTGGSTISSFSGTLEMHYLTLKSITPSSPWTNESVGTNLKFTASSPVSSAQFTIATLVFDVAPDYVPNGCYVNLSPCYDENGNYGCGNKITVEESYTCRVVGGKYYGKNGNEVTEAVYNAECVSNPQTGSSMPYLVIVAGIVLAVGVFTISRKNTKLYKI